MLIKIGGPCTPTDHPFTDAHYYYFIDLLLLNVLTADGKRRQLKLKSDQIKNKGQDFYCLYILMTFILQFEIRFSMRAL